MTLLIISPDYASHLYPLATLGTAWQEAGERVVVATGPATADIVAAFGFERINLQLGRGSNPGVIRAEEQPLGEDDALRGFFDATRAGMVETLTFQAEARSSDLLYNPVEIGREVQRIVRDLAPDHIIVDHLAFSARIALVSAGVAHADVVLGHPSALPVGDEVYGFPPAWPAAFRPDDDTLARLRAVCDDVRDTFTAQWNAAMVELDRPVPDSSREPGSDGEPGRDGRRAPSTDAFAESGDLLLLNYPGELHDPARIARLPPHAFLGSSVRTEPADPVVDEWLARSDDRIAYVSFGSFLSVRTDVLARVAAAFCGLGVRVAIATGSGSPADLPELPADWLVRPFLPQVRLLGRSAVAVTHGGNNRVTEAMSAAVPLLVLPFSTDQFAGAEAIEAAGVGESLAPNTASVDDIRLSLERLLARSRGEGPGADAGFARLSLIAAALAERTGPQRARDALLTASS